MKKFQQKQIDVGGKSVTVDVEEVFNPSGVATVKATATFGSATVELCHTMAPVDGAHATLDPAHVQNAIDELRQRAARMAILQDGLARQLASAQ